MSADPAVEIAGLVKTYGAVAALAGVDLSVLSGTVTAILGPNGAGKTTTVEICEGFRRADSGTVRVLGLDPQRDGRALKPRVGVMLQGGGGVYPSARPAEMLAHIARLHAHPLPVAPLIDRLGLGAAHRTPFRRLSGGERQRLALAMAVVGRPELVFLDEPTAGMDPHARIATWDLVREMRADGVTVVLTTHLLDEAEQLCDSVAIIDQGRVVAVGSPASLTAGGADSVRFQASPGLDLESLRGALPVDTAVVTVAPGHYVVSVVGGTVGPELIATVTAWCAAHNVLPAQLTVGSRTLEDVFLELTGRRLRA